MPGPIIMRSHRRHALIRRGRSLVCAVPFILLLTATSVRAQAMWTPNGKPVCVLPECGGRVPKVCGDGGGGALLVWQTDRNGNEDVFVQHALSGGTLAPGWPAIGTAATLATQDQRDPLIVPDGQGGAYLTWTDYRYWPADGADAYVQHVLANGLIAPGWPADGMPVALGPGDQYYTRLLPDGAGGVFIAWSDEAPSYQSNVYAQHLAGDGTRVAGWPANGLPVCILPLSQGGAELAPDGQGGFITAWGDNRNCPGTCSEIYAQRVTWSGGIVAGWPVDGKQITVGGRAAAIRGVIADGVGGAYIGWQYGFDMHFSDSDGYVTRILSDGSVAPGWPPNGYPVAAFNSTQFLTSVISDSAGGVLAAWYDLRDYPVVRAYVSRMRRDGTLAPGWQPGGNIVSDIPGYQALPRLAPDGSGGAYVAFVDAFSNQGYVQHLTAGGMLAPGWPTSGIALVNLSASTQHSLAISPDGSGGAIVTWDDFRNGIQNQIYAQRYNGDGPTPVLVSLASVSALPDRVTLIWHRGEGALSDVTIQRHREGDEWAMIAHASFDGTGRLTFEDMSVAPATRYAYRVAWTESGTEQFSAETWVDVPTALTLTLEGAFPNPAVDALNVAFTLPRGEPATLALLDVSGRQIASREVGGLGAGRHLVRLDQPGRTPPGVYWIQLTQSNRRLTKRAVVIN